MCVCAYVCVCICVCVCVCVYVRVYVRVCVSPPTACGGVLQRGSSGEERGGNKRGSLQGLCGGIYSCGILGKMTAVPGLVATVAAAVAADCSAGFVSRGGETWATRQKAERSFSLSLSLSLSLCLCLSLSSSINPLSIHLSNSFSLHPFLFFTLSPLYLSATYKQATQTGA